MYVLFLKRFEEEWVVTGPALSRINVEVRKTNSPWVQAVEQYVRIATLNDYAKEKQALFELRDSERKSGRIKESRQISMRISVTRPGQEFPRFAGALFKSDLQKGPLLGALCYDCRCHTSFATLLPNENQNMQNSNETPVVLTLWPARTRGACLKTRDIRLQHLHVLARQVLLTIFNAL